MTHLSTFINMNKNRLTDADWLVAKRDELDAHGAVQMRGLLQPDALTNLQKEATVNLSQAYFNPQTHNIYLDKGDAAYPGNHIRNRLLTSSKGCITDDQISAGSVLKKIYHHSDCIFALCFILGEDELHPYADSLSSVNIHYARRGEELNWHFDNSSFAVTLMIQPAIAGGAFEYVRDVRDADRGEMGFAQAEEVVDGLQPANQLSLDAGDLLLFRGQNSLHRVTPVTDDSMRQLAVLAYNSQPGISLSKTAQMTFYGRSSEPVPAV